MLCGSKALFEQEVVGAWLAYKGHIQLPTKGDDKSDSESVCSDPFADVDDEDKTATSKQHKSSKSGKPAATEEEKDPFALDDPFAVPEDKDPFAAEESDTDDPFADTSVGPHGQRKIKARVRLCATREGEGRGPRFCFEFLPGDCDCISPSAAGSLAGSEPAGTTLTCACTCSLLPSWCRCADGDDGGRWVVGGGTDRR